MESDLPLSAQSGAVEYTISEDHGAGHAAHAQSGFAMLAAGEDRLAGGVPGGSGAHSLQDYQWQLMLLEQQNKKRLMMARREQDLEQELDRARALRPVDHEMQPDPMQLEQQDTERPAPDGQEESQGLAPESTEPTGLQKDDGAGPRHVTLYRVVCSSSRAGCEGRVYQVPPTSTLLIQGELHLGGEGHVLDVSALLNARSPPVAFIVYRPVYCPHANQGNPSPAGRKTHGELISVVSPELQATMQRISKFSPDGQAYSSPRVWQPRAAGSLLSQSPSEYSPYFLYHHRDVLYETAKTEGRAPQIRALWSYLQRNPDPMWAKCDELFAHGLVSAETLPWLSQPNEVVLYRERQQDIACVLRKPPKWTASHSVSLDCWNWGYDGQSLRRKEKKITVKSPTYRTVPITGLAAYPLRYADDDTRERLVERGSKFWKLRNPTHVAYEGPDYQGERVYVSCRLSIFHTYQYADSKRNSPGTRGA
jgi:hypothetical protein